MLLGESMARMADRGLLRELPDPTLAAWPSAEELDHIADRATEVFLAAYGQSSMD